MFYAYKLKTFLNSYNKEKRDSFWHYQKRESEETKMKKFGAFLLAGVLAIGALTGCGSTDKKDTTNRKLNLMIMYSQTKL